MLARSTRHRIAAAFLLAASCGACAGESAPPPVIEPDSASRDVAGSDGHGHLPGAVVEGATVHAAQREREAVVDPARRVRGVAVLSGTDVPAPGVRVRQSLHTLAVRTDAAGRFELALVEDERPFLYAEVEGEAFAFFPDGTDVDDQRFGRIAVVEDRDEYRIEVAAYRTGLLRLQVTDRESGLGVGGRTVSVSPVRPAADGGAIANRSGVTSRSGEVLLEEVHYGPLVVTPFPYEPRIVVFRPGGAVPDELVVGVPAEVEVALTGTDVPAGADWRLVLSSDDARSTDLLPVIARGRGPRASFTPSLKMERRMQLERDWWLLAEDGSFFGSVAGGPRVLEAGRLEVTVEATARVRFGPLEDLTVERSAFHVGPDHWYGLEPLGALAAEPMIEPRCRERRWLPAGRYFAELRSVHHRNSGVEVDLVGGETRELLFETEPMPDLGALEVVVTSDLGEGVEDYPALRLVESGTRSRFLSPRGRAALSCGVVYDELEPPTPRFEGAPEGTGAVRVTDVQLADFRLDARRDDRLTERGRESRDGVLTVHLAWEEPHLERMSPEERELSQWKFERASEANAIR